MVFCISETMNMFIHVSLSTDMLYRYHTGFRVEILNNKNKLKILFYVFVKLLG